MDHGNPKKRPYHHGDLCRAILDAAERRLETGGLQAVTVRACARDAGVSPGAPLHHFGSLRGLLSALAARGFERLLARLDADLAAPDVRAPASLLVGAYVAFAVSSRPLFDLMWRDEVLDPEHDELVHSRRAALERLQALSAVSQHGREARLRAIRTWSLAHGLAMLLLHGRIVTALGSEEDALRTIEDFVTLAYDDRFSGD